MEWNGGLERREGMERDGTIVIAISIVVVVVVVVDCEIKQSVVLMETDTSL